MRKIHFVLLILSQFVFSQENKLKIDTSKIEFVSKNLTWTVNNCEEGNKSAIADFEKGIYNFYTYGFTISNTENDKLQAFSKKYLKDKYLINYEHRGCVITDESECYSETMINLIEEKFGKGFLEKKLEEAKKLYSKK